MPHNHLLTELVGQAIFAECSNFYAERHEVSDTPESPLQESNRVRPTRSTHFKLKK